MSGPFALAVLYLFDSILSTALPVSRGIFVLLVLPYLWLHADLRPGQVPRWKIAGFFALLGLAGIVGATISGTAQTAIFFLSILLMYLLWSGGSRIAIKRKLITPRTAMFAVIAAHAFLLLSLAGLDIHGLLTGLPSNRAAGLFSEPSHFGLYVTPLWIIAHHRTRYRRPLYAMLLFSVATLFSLTFALALLVALAVHIVLRAESATKLFKDAARIGALALAIVAGMSVIYDPVVFDDKTLSVYVEERIGGLFISPEDGTGGLSSLAVLQGIEIAGASFTASSGLGVGLGNLGNNESINKLSVARQLINQMTGNDSDLNLRDGGILLNKLIGELGIFVLAIGLLLVKQFKRLRAMPIGPANTYHFAMFAFIITELFVRGLPYFSAPSCLAIISMATLLHYPSNAASTVRIRKRRARHIGEKPTASTPKTDDSIEPA